MTVRSYGKIYERLHVENPKWFSGRLTCDAVGRIAQLVKYVGAKSLLDYGSGKGYQYLAGRMHDGWGGLLPHCYDPGVRQLSVKPEGKFDGIICTDVLEHIDQQDVPEILEDIFGYVNDTGFVYLEISCRPAHKKFPDGTNVHLTVKKPGWWRKRISKFERAGLLVEDYYEWIKELPARNNGDDVQPEWIQGLRA